MPAADDQPAKATDRRDSSAAAGTTKADRRVFVWWGVSLGLLLVLALVCWLVVGPAATAHRVLGEVERAELDRTRCYFDPRNFEDCAKPAVERLGGPERARTGLILYTSLPARIASHRAFAVLALGQCGGPSVETLIRALRNDQDDDVRLAAVIALGEIGPAARPAVPAIVGAARWDLASSVAEALGNIGAADKDVVECLSDFLADRRSDVPGTKAAAATALGKLGPAAKAAIPGLVSLLQNAPDGATRQAATDALGKIGVPDRDAVYVLWEVASEKDNGEPLRISAAQALAKIGPGGQEAWEILVEALEDTLKNEKSPRVRAAAAEALKKIRAEEPPK